MGDLNPTGSGEDIYVYIDNGNYISNICIWMWISNDRGSEIRINVKAIETDTSPDWEIVDRGWRVKYLFSPRNWNGVTLDRARQTRRVAVPPFHKLDLTHVGQFRLGARGRL